MAISLSLAVAVLSDQSTRYTSDPVTAHAASLSSQPPLNDNNHNEDDADEVDPGSVADPPGERMDNDGSVRRQLAQIYRRVPDITGSRILADITAKHIVRLADITAGYNWCLFLWHCPV